MQMLNISKLKLRPFFWLGFSQPRKLRLWLVSGFVLVLLSACGTRTTKPVSVEPAIAWDSVIAQDFVNIMVQIETLSPWSTILKFGLTDNALAHVDREMQTRHAVFARALRAAASSSGYAVETVQSENVQHYIRFNISQSTDISQPLTYTYDLSVGDVDFRRVYLARQDGTVEPFKAMMVRGANAQDLESDDSIFERQRHAGDNQLLARSTDNAIVTRRNQSSSIGFDSPLEIKRKPLLNNYGNKNLNETTPVVTGSVALAQPRDTSNTMTKDANAFQTVRKMNIADIGVSNYESLLVDKKNVAEEVLIFGDDSYVLGSRNKQLLNEIMSDFNPDTDVVSVVGCSTGVTKIENGNAALAIGRANRVKEALLYSGIPHDKIYDEGCWSPTPNSTPFPNRGVVITVKRNVNG